MGIYVTVNLDVEPLTAELLFPLGLPAGSSVDLIVAPPSQPKAVDRKSPFSLCHALVCGRRVPIARNNFDKSFEAPSVPRGLSVRSPLVNGQRICQLKNVRKGTSTKPVANAVPQTPPVDTVVADDPEECKKALEDIIKAGEPETKTVFVCTECPHRTFDKDEAVEHCKSHLASAGPADVASAAKDVPRPPPKRGRPPKERFHCNTCAKSFSSRQSLQTHLLNHTSRGAAVPLVTRLKSVFKLKRSLNIHVRAIHSQEGRRQCELCGKWLATERKLQRHVALTHYGDSVNAQDGTFPLLRPLKCDRCDFKSFSYPRLARHRVTHTGVYPHQCPECNKQFVFRDQMTRHVQSVHRKVRLSCQQCPRLFFSEKLFQQHLDAHRLGQGFPCTMCDNFYETKAALDHHSQSHEASLPYQCELCKQRFKYSQGLSIHRRFRHSKEARSSSQWKSGDHTWRHSCDVCHIRFKYQSSLAAHRLNRHTDAERLTCTYCSRSFNSQSVLALHIRSHTGEKPHVCPHCSKAFSIPNNLKNHIITQHTKEFKFFCPLCSKGAVSQIKLRQHLLQSHKAINDSSSKYKRTVTKTVPDMPDIDDLPMSQVAVEDAASILSQIIILGGTAGAIATCPLEVVKTRLQSSVANFHFAGPGGSPAAVQSLAERLGLNACTCTPTPTGGSGGGFTTSVINTSNARAPSIGIWRCLKQIVEMEGTKALFKGLGPNLVGVAPSRAIYFCTYSNSKSIFNELLPSDTPIVHICSAASAGFMSCTATNPIWFVKTRLQLDQRMYGSISALQCIRDIYQRHGLLGFYKGITASYFGISETIIHFVIYEFIKAQLRQRKESSRDSYNPDVKSTRDFVQFMAAGAVSKTCASTLAYPHVWMKPTGDYELV
ncbi:hypothetical protein HPB52_008298 [Rhipicephalus sanguineus]|uniref:C2H2-type domain-containing protein n=1 Tax=Rhipicephalus sanguineus TaxID=34632 RepID=A0A9D4SYD9_RHISA|nr:hypothetical protein HPB52_008298 [Rhipicephalus sanguineus]